MKITLNGKEHEVEPGAKVSTLVKLLEDTVKDDPMIISLKQRKGKSYLLFILNDRVLQPQDYDAIEVQEGDRLSMVHPVFGG